jgi:hypothetical protein
MKWRFHIQKVLGLYVDPDTSCVFTESLQALLTVYQCARKNKSPGKPTRAPADSENVHATAACTIRPTTESCESPSVGRLRERLPDSRDRNYVRSAIFVLATQPEHGCLPSDNAAAHPLRERPFSGPTQTFRVWYHKFIIMSLKLWNCVIWSYHMSGLLCINPLQEC